MADPKDKVLDSLISDFEKIHPEVKVDAQYVGNYDVLLQKILASVAAGNPPDMSQVYENWTTRLKDANAIVPVQNFIDQNGFTKEDIKDIYPIFISNNSYDKTIWTFPFNKSIYVYYYNASMFRKYGVTPPRNMEEFREVCRRLTRKDKNGKITQYGFGFRANIDVFAILFYMNKGKFFSDDGTKAVFNDSTGKETLQFILDMVNNEKIAYYTKDYLDNDFASGRMASFFATNPHRNYLEPLLSFPLGVAPLPAGKIQVAPIAGTNVAIFAKKDGNAGKRQEACWQFMKWLTSTDGTVKWVIGTSYLPIRKSALKNQTMQDYLKKQPLDMIAIKQLDNAVTDPRVKIWQEVRIYVGEALEKALLGKATASAALDEAAKKVNDLLEKNK